MAAAFTKLLSLTLYLIVFQSACSIRVPLPHTDVDHPLSALQSQEARQHKEVVQQQPHTHGDGILADLHHEDLSLLQTPGAVIKRVVPVVDRTSLPAGVQDAGGLSPLVFPLALLLAAAAIFFVYAPQGPRVVIGVTAYLLSLSTIKITVKLLFDEFGFKFPSFLTAVHLAVSTAIGFSVLLRRGMSTGKEVTVPTQMEFIGGVMPITCSFGLSLVANNVSLLSCSTSFNEIIGSTSPICTVAVVLFLGMPFDFRLIGPTFIVVAGCVIAVSGEARFSAIGFALVMLGNACRALKGAMQQKLMTGEARERFDPCTLLAWTCLTSCIMLFAWSAISEGMAPYTALAQQRQRPLSFLLALGASCANAALLNFASLFVTKDLGAVGVTVVAQTRAVLTIIGGVVVFNDVVSPQEVLGFTVVMAGAYAYARTEQQMKAGTGGGSSFVGSTAAIATFIEPVAFGPVGLSTAAAAPVEAPAAVTMPAHVAKDLPSGDTCRL